MLGSADFLTVASGPIKQIIKDPDKFEPYPRKSSRSLVFSQGQLTVI